MSGVPQNSKGSCHRCCFQASCRSDAVGQADGAPLSCSRACRRSNVPVQAGRLPAPVPGPPASRPVWTPIMSKMATRTHPAARGSQFFVTFYVFLLLILLFEATIQYGKNDTLGSNMSFMHPPSQTFFWKYSRPIRSSPSPLCGLGDGGDTGGQEEQSTC